MKNLTPQKPIDDSFQQGKSSFMLSARFIAVMAACFLSACTTSEIVEDPPAVKMAKACQRAKESNPKLLTGFQINACTHNGVWMVDEVGPDGQVVKRFDFLNRQYAGPESAGEFVEADVMGADNTRKLDVIRAELNKKLLGPK